MSSNDLSWFICSTQNSSTWLYATDVFKFHFHAVDVLQI